MRAVVIGNGTINNYNYIKSRLCFGDFIICADGGTRHAAAMGIKPDVVIGDFDSSQKPNDVTAYEFSPRKDFTDGELALMYAKEKGYSPIMLLGMTGDRLDHTLTDILMMSRYDGAYLVDDKNEIHIVKDRLVLRDMSGRTLSIIPVSGDVKGITARGLEWELNSETLYFGASRGNSNVINSDLCEIEIESGMAAVIIAAKRLNGDQNDIFGQCGNNKAVPRGGGGNAEGG